MLKKATMLALGMMAGTSFAAEIKSGFFTMLDKPFEEPNHSCYTGTNLTVQNGDLSGAMATLSEFVGGFCELYVAPNERTYFLTQAEKDGCGSTTYTGQKITLDGRQTLEVVDNRFRLCDDLVSGSMVATETLANGQVINYFSYDRASAIRHP